MAGERAPDVERAWLQNTTTPEAATDYCRAAAELGAKAVSVMDVSLTPEVVATGRELGLVVYSWVRTLEVQDRVIAAGPDGDRDRLGRGRPGRLDRLARPRPEPAADQLPHDEADDRRAGHARRGCSGGRCPSPRRGCTTLSTNDGPPQR